METKIYFLYIYIYMYSKQEPLAEKKSVNTVKRYSTVLTYLVKKKSEYLLQSMYFICIALLLALRCETIYLYPVLEFVSNAGA